MSNRRDPSKWWNMPKALAHFANADPDACWEWPGTHDARGRGLVYHKGRQRKAYRVAYELLVGPIAEGLEPDHLCRNVACFNPRHLEPVTHHTNMMRGVSIQADNARKTHCDHGHPFDAANTRHYRRKDGNGTWMRVCRACVLDDTHRRRARKRAASHSRHNPPGR